MAGRAYWTFWIFPFASNSVSDHLLRLQAFELSCWTLHSGGRVVCCIKEGEMRDCPRYSQLGCTLGHYRYTCGRVAKRASSSHNLPSGQSQADVRVCRLHYVTGRNRRNNAAEMARNKESKATSSLCFVCEVRSFAFTYLPISASASLALLALSRSVPCKSPWYS